MKNERMPITKDIAGTYKRKNQGVVVFKVTEKNIRAVANENAVYLRYFTRHIFCIISTRWFWVISNAQPLQKLHQQILLVLILLLCRVADAVHAHKIPISAFQIRCDMTYDMIRYDSVEISISCLYNYYHALSHIHHLRSSLALYSRRGPAAASPRRHGHCLLHGEAKSAYPTGDREET